MRSALVLILLVFAVADARAAEGASLKRTVDDLTAALVAGDAAKVKPIVITAAELVGQVKKVATKGAQQELDAQNKAFFDGLLRELAEGRKGGSKIAVGPAEILDVRILPPGDKLADEMVIAQVRLGFTIDGKPKPLGFPMAFMKLKGRWRVSAKN